MDSERLRRDSKIASDEWDWKDSLRTDAKPSKDKIMKFSDVHLNDVVRLRPTFKPLYTLPEMQGNLKVVGKTPPWSLRVRCPNNNEHDISAWDVEHVNGTNHA